MGPSPVTPDFESSCGMRPSADSGPGVPCDVLCRISKINGVPCLGETHDLVVARLKAAPRPVVVHFMGEYVDVRVNASPSEPPGRSGSSTVLAGLGVGLGLGIGLAAMRPSILRSKCFAWTVLAAIAVAVTLVIDSNAVSLEPLRKGVLTRGQHYLHSIQTFDQ